VKPDFTRIEVISADWGCLPVPAEDLCALLAANSQGRLVFLPHSSKQVKCSTVDTKKCNGIIKTSAKEVNARLEAAEMQNNGAKEKFEEHP
jgi:hypothetical protein